MSPDSPENKCPGDFLGDDLSGVHTCHAGCPCHSSGGRASVPSSPHETGQTAEQKARIEGIVDGVLVSFEQGKVAGRRLAKSRAALNGEGTE